MPSISWNVIIRNFQWDDRARTKLRQEIGQLEEYLGTFPPETVHLQMIVERRKKRPHYIGTLSLRAPADILSSRKSADDPMHAFDDALQALRRRLESRFGRKTRGMVHERGEVPELPQSPERPGFAAEPHAEGVGPQSQQEVIREFFRQHYNRLLYHVRRHIRHRELTGEIPVGALDPRDIADEAARQVEKNAGRKRAKISWLVWVFRVLHEELHRQVRLLKEEAAEDISTEKRVTLPELKPRALQPLDQMVERFIEPQVIRVEDIVANPEALPPDRLLADKELLEELQQSIQTWPRTERDVFEFYFVQGFEPAAIAHITGRPVKRVRETLAAVQSKLRQEMPEILTRE